MHAQTVSDTMAKDITLQQRQTTRSTSPRLQQVQLRPCSKTNGQVTQTYTSTGQTRTHYSKKNVNVLTYYAATCLLLTGLMLPKLTSARPR